MYVCVRFMYDIRLHYHPESPINLVYPCVGMGVGDGVGIGVGWGGGRDGVRDE